MKTLLSFAARTQWSGILVGVIAGGIALSFASPAFMTEFNWFVMLRSICVSLLVAFSQMVMLGGSMKPYAWTHIALGAEFGFHLLSPEDRCLHSVTSCDFFCSLREELGSAEIAGHHAERAGQ